MNDLFIFDSCSGLLVLWNVLILFLNRFMWVCIVEFGCWLNGLGMNDVWVFFFSVIFLMM